MRGPQSSWCARGRVKDPIGSLVVDGDRGNEYRRQLLPSYKANRRKFSRESSASQRSSSSHLVTEDLLRKCNVPVGRES